MDRARSHAHPARGVAAEPGAARRRRSRSSSLRRLQYALHLASEHAFGLAPPAGAEPAHAELAAALARRPRRDGARSSRRSTTGAPRPSSRCSRMARRALPRAARPAAAAPPARAGRRSELPTARAPLAASCSRSPERRVRRGRDARRLAGVGRRARRVCASLLALPAVTPRSPRGVSFLGMVYRAPTPAACAGHESRPSLLAVRPAVSAASLAGLPASARPAGAAESRSARAAR